MSRSSTYQVYLYKNTFSGDENQRLRAEINVRLAMDEASARIGSYGEAGASTDWSVVVYQGPHSSNQRPKKRGRKCEPRHYSVFGFLPDDDGVIDHFIEHWYLHIYVDKDNTFSGFRCGKSTQNLARRQITADAMTFLSGSCNL